MNTCGVDLMGRRRRRRRSAEFMTTVIEECLRPGVSIAEVALAHGLNANMLRKWVIDGEHRLASAAVAAPPALDTPPTPAFVPLALTAPADEAEIRIELQRGGTTVKLVWPASASRDCAAWLRDWLR